MGLLKQFNALIWSWSEMLRALRKGIALWPFVLYAAVQSLLVLAVVGFAYPPLSVIAPALKWRLGEAALHYPGNLFALRPALGQADSILIVVLGAVLTATAVHVFAEFYAGRGETFREGFRAAARRYIPLVAVAAVLIVATHLLARLPFTVWSDLAERSPAVFRVLRFGAIGVVVALQALLVYSTPYLVLGRRGLVGAVVGSLRLAVATPVTSLLIVGVPAAFELLPLWLSRQSSAIATRLSPEILIAVMLLWIVVILMAAYVTAGASTRFFLHATQDDDDRLGRGEA